MFYLLGTQRRGWPCQRPSHVQCPRGAGERLEVRQVGEEGMADLAPASAAIGGEVLF